MSRAESYANNDRVVIWCGYPTPTRCSHHRRVDVGSGSPSTGRSDVIARPTRTLVGSGTFQSGRK
jgi:hypothetical protein